ncbi:mechanosensitive ion channel family protein [Nodosilinea sp. LEGE 07088]|nr:mechanosensitive ion channel family protein [Nodosilinea sp. LEGE 07088]
MVQLALAIILALGFGLATSPPSQAQFALPEGFSTSNGLNPPPDVTRIGGIEMAPVHSPVTGAVLFQVASPTIYDRGADGVDLTAAVERRAEEVNARLRRATFYRQDPPMDLESLMVSLGKLNGIDVITVKDATYTQPLVLLTVTQTDADYHGIPVDELGETWRQILADDLRAGIQQLSPEEVAKDISRATGILFSLVTVTVLSLVAKHLVRRYQRRLRQRKKALSEPQTPEIPFDPQQTNPEVEPEERVVQHRNHFLQGFDQILSLDRRLGVLSLVQWLLFWVVILVWYVGLFSLFRRVPLLEQFSNSILGKPIQLLGIWFLTGLAIRLTRRLIDRFTSEREGVDLVDFLNFGDTQRRQLRASTIGGAAKGLVTVAIAGIGVLMALGALGLPTGSVVAIGGIFGLAISFGSQSLVKDLVNGFLILAEDQFAIGDVIDTGSAAGLVENLNLRVTQLRSSDGELVTIPNSGITQVKNLTRSWSRVNFSIDVAYHTAPDKALAVLKEIAQGFYNDPIWQEKMLAPPDVLGIDGVSHSGITITTWIQTAPAQQWAVGREFRFRVCQALAEQGIEIGTPTYALAAGSDQDNDQRAGVNALGLGS